MNISNLTSLEINMLGQILDTTFGRTSTAESATASIKTNLLGDILDVRYACIAHFGCEQAMSQQKQQYDDESVKLTDDYMASVKKQFKQAAGRALKVKQLSTDDEIEIISSQPHISPKRVAYYRRVSRFEIS